MAEQSHVSHTAVYDLIGRKVADDYDTSIKNHALPKGIYIVGGKKIVR
ncbi:MAG: hypothetical protein J6N73_08260 [Prevotella sp.]|nr:hypothetical protein [Prevotella sp.]